ncbi:HBR111Cp [Eremothecium sinecaudum]|uniref:HBR111Cp n=1 Tax=Eremothecium sinecaudum TaxID=45286 RepID=A0A109UXL5_9SACH|nr:HBR111Cp [Eremothecium sinecaudum]AMD19012.1 HBR111Cp [Eremothecium sinecaudum]
MGYLTTSRYLTNLSQFKKTDSLSLNSIWPVHRRAAVLVLLFIGNRGELRVLLTKRSRRLNSFSGQVSLPGGKADNESETFEAIARREAQEEIGLPSSDEVLLNNYGLKLDSVSREIPHYLSQTFLSVKPWVCFLYNAQTDNEKKFEIPLTMKRVFTKLNPGETSSVFSIPLSDLIFHEVSNPRGEKEYVRHEEYIAKWGGIAWKIRHYYYSLNNIYDVPWLNEVDDLSSDDGIYTNEKNCRHVWGLTAKILHDIAMVAEGIMDPEQQETSIGHEELIHGLYEFGSQLHGKERTNWEKNMMKGKKQFKYSDVIPSSYWDKLNTHIRNF